jgi:hypothetical protein
VEVALEELLVELDEIEEAVLEVDKEEVELELEVLEAEVELELVEEATVLELEELLELELVVVLEWLTEAA